MYYKQLLITPYDATFGNEEGLTNSYFPTTTCSPLYLIPITMNKLTSQRPPDQMTTISVIKHTFIQTSRQRLFKIVRSPQTPLPTRHPSKSPQQTSQLPRTLICNSTRLAPSNRPPGEFSAQNRLAAFSHLPATIPPKKPLGQTLSRGQISRRAKKAQTRVHYTQPARAPICIYIHMPT